MLDSSFPPHAYSLNESTPSLNRNEWLKVNCVVSVDQRRGKVRVGHVEWPKYTQDQYKGVSPHMLCELNCVHHSMDNQLCTQCTDPDWIGLDIQFTLRRGTISQCICVHSVFLSLYFFQSGHRHWWPELFGLLILKGKESETKQAKPLSLAQTSKFIPEAKQSDPFLPCVFFLASRLHCDSAVQ